jgi:exosortase/archaeosortase family protein
MFQLSAFRQALCALPFAWLWFVLINELRVEWTVNPQYSYGWAVPLLCVFLIWQRMQKAESGKRKAEIHFSFQLSKFQLFTLALCALLYAPTRLVQEANPGWRLVSWALAIEVVGITLCALSLMTESSSQRAEAGKESAGEKAESRKQKAETGSEEVESGKRKAGMADFLFPVVFFLVAVPWPSKIEYLLIQGLTRADTNVTAELLGWLGIPAMPHGNVIEVATGMVGIDEACSGIRSFQATLMISLFLGELYRLTVFRRSVLCLAGFALSFLFNLARMSLLVWVAARQGLAAIASWHDPAGVTILVACFLALWLAAVWLGKKQGVEGGKRPGEIGEDISRAKEGGGRPGEVTNQTSRAKEGAGQRTTGIPTLSTFNFQLSTLQKLALALGTWIVVSEVSVEAWYRSHETRVPEAAQWTTAWPAENPTLKELPLAGVTRQILRYDEGRSATWREGDWVWQAVFLRWRPGRTAMHLAQNHTPEVCMTGAGHTLKSISPQEWFEVNGLRMPFLAYQVTDAPQPFFVFYCLWDDRAGAQGFKTMGLTYGNRLAPVLAGLRNPGQRSLEIAVTGPENPEEARTALRAELNKLIVFQP